MDLKLWLNWRKWTLLVWLNAAFSFSLSLGKYPQLFDRVAIVCGVFSFVLLYVKIDNYLLNSKRFQARNALLVSVCIKSLFQLYPGVELAAGIASTTFVAWIIGNIRFISAYLITLMDGLLLSLIVAIITGMINFVMHKLPHLTTKRI
ncbi:MAG: hypothetical protein NTV00_00415 [Methylococcales bacterium]|nr:hypothetical protein [Methylococcales bacterium]